MKNFYLMLFFFIGNLHVFSQNYIVKGNVTDFHNRSFLANAEVTLGKLSTKTDANGNFIFQKVSAGKHLLEVKHPDCDPYTQTLSIFENTELRISLEHHAKDIESVLLQGVHKNDEFLMLKTIDQKTISRNSTENLGNLLTKISGVTALKTGNNITKPVIHGLYGDRIGILNNGVKLEEQEWGVEHAPNVDVNGFQHIDVIKGASALKYGSGFVGGVILLEPAVFPKKDSLFGVAKLSGISNGRGVDFNLNLVKTWENAWVINANGGFKKSGDLQTPNYGLYNTGMEMNAFNFSLYHHNFNKGISLDYAITNQEIGIYRGTDLGNLNDFYTALTSDTPLYLRPFSYKIENPKQDILHQIAKISAYKRFKNLGKISLDYSFQYNHRKEYDVRRGSLYNIPALDLQLYTNQIKLNDFIERKNWSLESGFNFMYQNNYSSTSTQAKRLIPNYDKYAYGLYSVFKYQFSHSLSSEIGARLDKNIYKVKMWYNLADWENLYAAEFPQFYVKTEDNRVFTKPVLPFNNFSFNAGFTFKPSKNFNLEINYAKVSRTPNIAELFADGLHHSAAIIEEGDLRLKNENGNQFNVLINGNINFLKAFNFSVNPYLFLTKNFITEIPTSIQNTIRGVFPVWTYKQINAKMYGLDVDAELKFTDFLDYKGRFSYVYGQDITNNKPLILMMPPNFSNAIEFTHTKWNNFYLKIENQYVMHQKRFPIYNPSVLIYENGVEVQKTLDLSTPPPAYSFWNVQTGLVFKHKFTLGLNISNVFNQKYKDYLNRLRFFSYEMGRNIVLNVKYNF